MPVAAFEPRYMKIGVLTAALQELTPRAKRDPDPDLAIEEWAAFAREVGADYMQLSAALHPSEADVQVREGHHQSGADQARHLAGPILAEPRLQKEHPHGPVGEHDHQQGQPGARGPCDETKGHGRIIGSGSEGSNGSIGPCAALVAD